MVLGDKQKLEKFYALSRGELQILLNEAGTISKLARKAGVSAPTVARRLQELQIKPVAYKRDPKALNRFRKLSQARLSVLYAEIGTKNLAIRFSVHPNTVLSKLNALGILAKRRPRV